MIHDYKTYALATEHDDTLSILRCVANPTNHIWIRIPDNNNKKTSDGDDARLFLWMWLHSQIHVTVAHLKDKLIVGQP